VGESRIFGSGSLFCFERPVPAGVGAIAVPTRKSHPSTCTLGLAARIQQGEHNVMGNRDVRSREKKKPKKKEVKVTYQPPKPATVYKPTPPPPPAPSSEPTKP